MTANWYDDLGDLDLRCDNAIADLRELAERNDRASLARRGYHPDDTGRYWAWSDKWGEYCYLTAAELIAEYRPPVTLDRAMLREWEEAEAAREVAG